MKKSESNTLTSKTKVVSVKLDSSTQTRLEQEAAEKGISVSEVLRRKIDETKAITKETLPVAAAGTPTPQAVILTDETLLNIASIVAESVKGGLPKTIEVNTPIETNPEREYLRKIAGIEPESDYTLSVEEENYLSNLRESIKAEIRESLLVEQKSVPIPSMGSPLAEKTFIEMVAKRNELVSDKMPNLQTVFQNAILSVFVEDSRTLYNRSLFKSTYGFDYNEFKAIFEL